MALAEFEPRRLLVKAKLIMNRSLKVLFAIKGLVALSLLTTILITEITHDRPVNVAKRACALGGHLFLE